MYTSILFDMDNTLLQSNINFKQMRTSLIEYIVERGIASREEFEGEQTPAQVLEHAKTLQGTSPSLEQALWDIVAQYELLGMEHVTLEEGVSVGLKLLQDKAYRLAVVTNNAYETACVALEQMNIAPYFEVIVGREQMRQLKPSPSGIVHALKQLASSPDQAVMVGDSWIDGKAAYHAQVDFIAYKAKEQYLRVQNIEPILSVTHFDEVVEWIINR